MLAVHSVGRVRWHAAAAAVVPVPAAVDRTPTSHLPYYYGNPCSRTATFLRFDDYDVWSFGPFPLCSFFFRVVRVAVRAVRLCAPVV